MALQEKDIPSDSPRRKNLRPTTPKRTAPLRLLPWKNGKSTALGNLFGAPSYPSPLDRIRTGRRERARQLGLETPINYAEFEMNQSFPGTARPQRPRSNSPVEMGDLKRCTLENVKATTHNCVSFVAGGSKGCFSCSPGITRQPCPFSGSWVYYSFVGSGHSGLAFPTGVQNPNKAVFTVDGNSGEILMANRMACRLLCVNGSQLSGKHLGEFLKVSRAWYSTHDAQINTSGELVSIAGKVVELVNNEGQVIPVSVWVHQLTSSEQPRHIIVLEPVTRMVATVLFDKQGTVLRADEKMALLYGSESTSSLEGLRITQLLPFLKLPLPSANLCKLPQEIKTQNTTACTRDGISFPVTAHLKIVKDSEKECRNDMFKAILWVFANISGLVTVFPDGSIHSCNDNFALTLFGYDRAQLPGKNITLLIPSFYDDLEFLDTESILLPPLDDEDESEDCKFVHPSLRRNDSCRSYGTPRPVNPMGRQIELMIEDASQVIHSLALDSPSRFAVRNSSASEPPTRSPSADCFLGCTPAMLPSGSCHAQLNTSTCGGYVPGVPADQRRSNHHVVTNRIAEKEMTRDKMYLPLESELADSENAVTSIAVDPSPVVATGADRTLKDLTSTPNDVHERPPKFVMNRYGSLESLQSIPEGCYFGLGMHKNGSDMAIIYHIKRVELDDGHVLYCLWISRDPEEMSEGGRPYCSLTFQSSFYNSISKTALSSDTEYSSELQESIFPTFFEEGDYSQCYTSLNQIGRGGFGFVKLAYRNSDKLLVVTKFIDKKHLCESNTVFDVNLNKTVPLEISLLSTLNHPNIVQVVDMFENEQSFQLILEKHGCGMDLFEFIDRKPILDEPLASYLFRQLVSAISYLHRLNIVHRDIKDENIILDHKFHLKLIDFGSAALMAPDRYFSSFCGTTDFCSPEVLRGEKYKGPELEVWAVGVTLYVIIYGQSPFFDVDEISLGVLHPPFAKSQSLMHLLSRILDPDPKSRSTLDEAACHPWTVQPISLDKYCFEDVIPATYEEINPDTYYNLDEAKDRKDGKVPSPVKSPRCEVVTASKDRCNTSLSNTSDECYEEQDSC